MKYAYNWKKFMTYSCKQFICFYPFINLAWSKYKTLFAKLRAYSVKTNVHITRCDFVESNERSFIRF